MRVSSEPSPHKKGWLDPTRIDITTSLLNALTSGMPKVAPTTSDHETIKYEKMPMNTIDPKNVTYAHRPCLDGLLTCKTTHPVKERSLFRRCGMDENINARRHYVREPTKSTQYAKQTTGQSRVWVTYVGEHTPQNENQWERDYKVDLVPS